MPTVSFIMPAYKSQYLALAIESIVSQTSDNWELVVIDDASPEPLSDVVAHYHDERISYHRNKNNIGGKDLVKQWNHCINFASGDFLVLAADDDLYEPTFCAEIERLISKYPDVDLIRARVQQIDEDGNDLPYSDGMFPECSSKYEYLHDWITAKVFSCIGNYAFRRSSLLKMGGFVDFPCAFGSDIATPIALSINGVANTDEMLFKFRQSSNHLSSDKSRYKEKLEAISQLSEWLIALDWPTPEERHDLECFSVASKEYLHQKCIYDYFNLVINNIRFKDLHVYLKRCRLASFGEKCIMVLRWIKRHTVDK